MVPQNLWSVQNFPHSTLLVLAYSSSLPVVLFDFEVRCTAKTAWSHNKIRLSEYCSGN